MVGVTQLRHEASNLSVDSASFPISRRDGEMTRLRRLLAEAQTLDDVLVIWANKLHTGNWYSTCTVQDYSCIRAGTRILNGTVHIYPTLGHAGI